MSYDLTRINDEVIKVCGDAGVPTDIPVSLNGRLTRTLGRLAYANGQPARLEFSKLFISTGTDESIHQVILHECAHYIAFMRSGERHGHDAYFKAICQEIGCTNDKTTYDAERVTHAEKLYKYAVYCPNCGFIGGMSRYSRTLKNLDHCYCKNCGSEELSYVTNW